MNKLLRYSILLLAVAATVLAHGDDEPEPGADGMPGMEMPQFNLTELRMKYDITSFLNMKENKTLLLAHIFLMSLAFIFVLPASVMLSIAKSPLHTPIHVAFLALVAMALAPGVIYKARTPDLYPNNVHSKFGWVMVLLLALHFGAGFFKTLLGWTLSKPNNASTPSAQHQQYTAVQTPEERLSLDSVNGGSFSGSSGSVTLDGFEEEVNGIYDAEFGYRYTDGEHGGREYVLETGDNDGLEKLTLPHHPLSIEYRVQSYVATVFQPVRNALAKLPRRLLSSLYISSSVIFALLNRPMILLGFFQLMTGLITATNTGRDKRVFSMLAHTIKGAVFMWFGVLTFGRVLGAYADLGWAWNVRPPMKQSRMSLGARFFNCNVEMVESGLIFFYGITNVFMEHLANPGGAWSHKDLQHVSIAFMYIGGGLCGILYESSNIGRLFNASVRSKFHRRDGKQNSVDVRAAEPEQYGFSYNPFPLFIVFWTGILMSQHHQTTELSTKIHMQWGYLLACGAVIRVMSYSLMYISPPKTYLPSRPMTEVLVSFCLIAGGAVFMASNEETVEALLYYGIDGMFIMNLTVGFTALAMAWIMVLMALKGWATARRA
ncbi:hypothetical protein V1512DRAFT_260466 [Lipomyces arxii]|uniref:uncharacterized protein n=1 Tax=Lipomyces arxii TaxID=56418 RepID=UPI0034CDEB2C